MLNSRQTKAIIGLILALVSNFLILATTSPALKLTGGVLLFCLIPGYLWVTGLLPAKPWGKDPQYKVLGLSLIFAPIIVVMLSVQWYPGEVTVARALLPIYLLALVLIPNWAWDNELEYLALGAGLSFALSILVVLNLQWLPGELTIGRILLGSNLLIVLGAAIALIRHDKGSDEASQRTKPPSHTVLVVLLLILLLGGALRVVNLDYSEFQDDEVDIVQVSLSAIQGDKHAVLNDTRGPVRTMLAAAFFLYTDRVGEIDVRWPTAVASVAGILGVFCLGRRLFNPTVGLLAAAIVAVEGINLGYGRIVQQESLVNLMVVMAVLCFVLAYERTDRTTTRFYHILGILLFSVGLLAHYEVGLMAPLLLWLWIGSEGPPFLRQSWRVVLLNAAVLVLILGSFYIPFFLSPAFEETYQHYSSDILGSGLADNLRQFMSVTSFYNSIFLVVPLVLLFIFAYSHVLAQRRQWVGWFYGLGSLALCSVGLAHPGRLAPLGLLWFGSLVIVLILTSPRVETQPSSKDSHSKSSPTTWQTSEYNTFKIIFVWLMLYFIPYLYIVGLPRMHYYTFTFPWAMVSAYGLYKLWRVLSAKPLRVVLVTVLGICYALAIYHGITLFVSHTPEWAMFQPEKPIPFHPQLHTGRPGEYFGFPQTSGWRTIAELYRTGILRGPYETNELHQKVDWYLRRLLREPGKNRYYFIAEDPHRIQAGPPPAPFVPDDYQEIGVVTVAGEPKLHVFERHDGKRTHTEITPYTNEVFETEPEGIRPLDTYRLWWEYEADDQFYLDVARYLEEASQPEDGIILDHPAQVELLSTYYRGDLPYYPLPRPGENSEHAVADELTKAAMTHPRLFALLWAVEAADPDHHVERWLDENLFKADERWFGNVRVAVYAAPRGPTGEMQHKINVKMGNEILLSGYTVQGEPFHVGEIMPLRLFWESLSVSDPVGGRYKVFVHVLDDQSQIVAQRDSEPAGGSRPTNTWLPGEVIGDNQGVVLPTELPTGQYRIAVGMYDPQTGARLPAVDAQREPIPDDRILLGTVEIEAP